MSPEGADSVESDITTQERDKYWNRIKILLIVVFGCFVGYIVVFAVRVPEAVRQSENIQYSQYPLVAFSITVLGASIAVLSIPFLYFVSKDKEQLARELPDVTPRHWVTVGVFTLFSYGIYVLWYFYARYKKGRSLRPDGWSSLSTRERYVYPVTQQLHQDLPRGWSFSGAVKGFSLQTEFGRVFEGEEDPPEDPAAVLDDVRGLQSTGDSHFEVGDYEQAIAEYENAIERLEAATTQGASEESGDSELDEVHTEIREKIAEAENRLSQIEEVREPLQNAESSFQIAIAEHVHTELTPASRDYRQASEQYDQALRALDESDFDVFDAVGELSIPVMVQADPVPTKLEDWPGLSNHDRQTLVEAGFGTLAELKEGGEPAIQNLLDEGTIDADLANRLHVALWWHGTDERTVTNRRAVERKRDRASEGYSIC